MPLLPPARRNKEASISVGDDSVILTAKKVELNRKGPKRLPLVQLDVSFTSTDANWKPVEFPLAIYERLYDEKRALARGKGVAVIAGRILYCFFPEDFGVELPAAAKPSSGLTLRSRKPVTALSARKSTTVPFVAEGGKPPYDYTVAMDTKWLGSHGRDETFQDDLIKVAAKGGTVTVDGPALLQALMADGSRDFRRALYENVKRRGTAATGAEFVDIYAQEVSNKLQPALGKPLHDFPVGVPVIVTVTDADGQKVGLRHELILELPREKIADFLDGEFSRDRDVATQEPLAQLGIANPAQPRSLLVPRPNLPLIWNEGTQVDVANEFRRLWPRVAIDDPQWSVERLALPLLDDESLEHAWIGVQRLRKIPEYVVRRGTASDSRITVRPHPAGAGINAFRNHYGCLPPRAIVDEAGKPLLSWRVSLLPYLGYQKLFHLFHLDEPWDSEHNRKLIPYVPMFYNSTQSGLPLGKTTFKALSGPGTAFPNSGLRRLHDFEGSPANALVIVEVDKSASVEWTKPEDLERTEDNAWTDQLYKVQVEGNDYSHGVFGDGVLWIFRISDEDT